MNHNAFLKLRLKIFVAKLIFSFPPIGEFYGTNVIFVVCHTTKNLNHQFINYKIQTVV